MFKVTCDGQTLIFNNPHNAVGVYVTICKDRGVNYEGIPLLNDKGVLIGIVNGHDIVDCGAVIPKQ